MEGAASILIVDDEAAIRLMLASQLKFLGFGSAAAANAEEALRMARQEPRPELVLSDIEMPGTSGLELLRQLKQLDSTVQVVMVSGLQDISMVRECLRQGAYDYLVKPFDIDDLGNTVRRAIERARLIRQNEEYRHGLERMVLEQTEEIRQTRDIAILTLAKLAESRDSETGLHLERMAAYSRCLAQSLRGGLYDQEVTEEFSEHLHRSSPLHDIGKVGIPDAILRKPGPLTTAQMSIMRTHTTIGGDTLHAVIEQYTARGFLSMGREIAYNHHEHWNGDGYPRGISGTAIPLAARIVALADAYDAITSKRPYKQAFSHDEAIRRIVADRGAHFDPQVVDAFLRSSLEFAEIQRKLKDRRTLSGETPIQELM
ncbi:MAG: HD domain-containing phosphohydrolase [Acidobacteriota bacterium]